MLQTTQPLLSAERIRSRLNRPMEILVFDELESTNLTLKKYALNGAPDGTAVFAEQQSGGRGRLGRSFFSPPGTGLYFSLLVRTSIAPDRAVMVTTAASVAVARAIDRVCGCSSQIKWINDIYLDGKKICGILSDGVVNLQNGTFDFIIVGIGINVNTPQEAFPEDLQSRAGSILSITGKETIREVLAAELLNQLQAVRQEMEDGSYLDEYRKRSCVIGRVVRVYGAGCDGEEAIVQSIDENGFLLAQLCATGKEILLNSGEITLRSV